MHSVRTELEVLRRVVGGDIFNTTKFVYAIIDWTVDLSISGVDAVQWIKGLCVTRDRTHVHCMLCSNFLGGSVCELIRRFLQILCDSPWTSEGKLGLVDNTFGCVGLNAVAAQH